MFRPPLKLKKGAGQVKQSDPNQAKRRFRIGMVIFFAWAIASIYVMQAVSIKLGFAMLCGLGFGLLIERAQICFTSAFRDLWATGRAYMGKAIIYGMLIGTLCVFSYIQLGMNPKIMWAGPNALIGGLLFGFGIVLAGGCNLNFNASEKTAFPAGTITPRFFPNCKYFAEVLYISEPLPAFAIYTLAISIGSEDSSLLSCKRITFPPILTFTT